MHNVVAAKDEIVTDYRWLAELITYSFVKLWPGFQRLKDEDTFRSGYPGSMRASHIAWISMQLIMFADLKVDAPSSSSLRRGRRS